VILFGECGKEVGFVVILDVSKSVIKCPDSLCFVKDR
jgi:hypothetical protein